MCIRDRCTVQYCKVYCTQYAFYAHQIWSPQGHGLSLEDPRGQLTTSFLGLGFQVLGPGLGLPVLDLGLRLLVLGLRFGFRVLGLGLGLGLSVLGLGLSVLGPVLGSCP